MASRPALTLPTNRLSCEARRVTRSVAVFGFLLFGYFGFVGCSSGCPGTVVNGTCQKTCQDSQCAAGDVCVGNACRPACTSSAQCGAGQTCTARVSDSGKRGTYCTGGGSSSGVISEKPCGASSDCDEKSGVRCVGGTCTFTCEVHDDCVTCSGPGQCISAGSCTGTVKDVEGNDVRVCHKDSFPRAPGQFGSHCPHVPGTPDCDAANDFTCIGTKGDIDAYCTKNFCGGDGDCPTGFFCATVQVTARPCDATCGFPSPTPGTCVASSDIGVGKHYQCGAVPHSLVTTQCLHRQFCAPCKADADCLAVRHQVCAKDASGEKICTVLCDDNINSCPWGTAASCHTTDDALGAPTCSHRFGSRS